MRKYVFLDNLETIKKEMATTRRKQYLRLLDQCDRYFVMYLPEEHPKVSSTYMGIAIVNLGLAYLVSEDERFLEEAKRFMFTVCKYNVWGNAHLVNVDLSASWIMFGLSLGYDWLKDYLNDEEKTLIREKLILQSKIMYDYKKDTEGSGWSTNYFQNHNWINMTGLAACGYALEGEYKLAPKYITECKKNFKTVFGLMSDDGSNYEGVVYWNYGGMWLFIYAHLLNVQEGINYFKKSKYLKNTFFYRLYQSAGDLKRQHNFGDAHDRYSGHVPCVYYKTAAEYKNGFAQYFGNLVTDEFLYEEAYCSKVKPHVLPQAALDLMWYEPSVKPKNINKLPKTRVFEDLGLVCVRTGFDTQATTFSFKCGYPGGKKQWEEAWKINETKNWKVLSLSHHHPDNTSFILNKGRAFFTTEDGYNRNIMPTHHSVVVVDGKTCAVDNVNDVYMKSVYAEMDKNPNFNPVNDFYGELEYFYNNKDLTIFKGQTAKTMDTELEMTDVSRLVITNNLGYIVMIDSVASNKEHTYQTVLNADTYPKENNGTYTYTDSLEKMEYSVTSDKDITASQFNQEVKAVMTTQEPENYCQVFMKTLSFSSSNKVKEQKFYQVYNLNESTIETTKNYTKINGNEYVLFNNDLGFVFNGEALYVTTENNNVTSVTLINGTSCTLNGKELVNANSNDVHHVDGLNEVLK
ncbi:MAG: DUF4962 domain-containing protein [bacterium]